MAKCKRVKMTCFAQFSVKVETKKAIVISFDKICSPMFTFKREILANLKYLFCRFTVLCFLTFFFAVCIQEIATFQVGLNSEMTKKCCMFGKICKSHIYKEKNKEN